MRTLEEILQSTSDSLFPAGLGRQRVTIDSHGSDGDTPLHILLWRKDFGGASELISAGADPNAIGDMGETPLHVAIRQDASTIISSLLDAGADPEIRSEFGDTPRSMATSKRGSIARMLKQAASNSSFKPKPLRGSA
jgi:ankyrin repeat protein